MSPLNEQQVQSLSAAPNKPLEINDDIAKVTYYVLSRDAFQYVEPFLIDRNIREQELRRELQIGFDDEENGTVEPWEVNSVLREGRDNLKKRASTR